MVGVVNSCPVWGFGFVITTTSPLLRTSFAFGDSTPLELRTCAGRSPPKTELPRELEPRPYGGTRLLLQRRWVWHSRSYAHPSYSKGGDASYPLLLPPAGLPSLRY